MTDQPGVCDEQRWAKQRISMGRAGVQVNSAEAAHTLLGLLPFDAVATDADRNRPLQVQTER